MTGHGNGSWQQFPPGHTAAETSGAYSPRKVEPRAAELAAALLADSQMPDHLRRPEFAAEVAAWARAEAKAGLVHEWLESLPVEQQVTPRKAGVTAPVEIWRKLEGQAAARRRSLGLEPLAAARLAKDLTVSRWYQVRSPLDELHDRVIAEQQRELEGGSDA